MSYNLTNTRVHSSTSDPASHAYQPSGLLFYSRLITQSPTRPSCAQDSCPAGACGTLLLHGPIRLLNLTHVGENSVGFAQGTEFILEERSFTMMHVGLVTSTRPEIRRFKVCGHRKALVS